VFLFCSDECIPESVEPGPTVDAEQSELHLLSMPPISMLKTGEYVGGVVQQ